MQSKGSNKFLQALKEICNSDVKSILTEDSENKFQLSSLLLSSRKVKENTSILIGWLTTLYGSGINQQQIAYVIKLSCFEALKIECNDLVEAPQWYTPDWLKSTRASIVEDFGNLPVVDQVQLNNKIHLSKFSYCVLAAFFVLESCNLLSKEIQKDESIAFYLKIALLITAVLSAYVVYDLINKIENIENADAVRVNRHTLFKKPDSVLLLPSEVEELERQKSLPPPAL